MIAVTEKDMLIYLEQMNENDSAIRLDAIGMVTGIKDGRLLYPLVKALQDDDLGIQQAAMDALVAYDDEAAVYNLIPLLADRRVSVKNMAQEILEKTGGSGLDLLHSHINDKDEDVRKMIADILGRLELPEAVPILIDMLKDTNDNVRSSAVEGLGSVTDPSIVDSLIGLLDQGDWVALFVVESLGRIGDKKAVGPIVRIITSSNNIDVQVIAIEALSHIGGEEAVDGLLKVIDCVSPEIMDKAVMGIVTLTQGKIAPILDKFGREDFVRHLERIADNADMSEPEVILNILQVFMTIGSGECTEHILKMTEGMDRENPDLLNMAVVVLQEVGDEETLINSLRHDNDLRKGVSVRVLGLLRSEKSIPALAGLFENADRDLMIDILSAMGNIGSQEAFLFLTDKLSYGEGHIREAAVDALGELATPDAIEPLLNHLKKEEYHNVIGKVVRALVKIGQRYKKQELAEGLISNLYSKKPSVREMAVRGLGELKWVDSAEYISGLLSDENWRVRRACLEAQSNIGDKDLLENLIIAAHDEKDEVRLLVAQLLGEHSDCRAIDELIELLENNNEWIQFKAIEGLAKQKAERAIPYLIKLAGSVDYTVSKGAIWALGELEAREAEDILRSAANHEDPEIQETAIEAFNKLRSRDNAAY